MADEFQRRTSGAQYSPNCKGWTRMPGRPWPDLVNSLSPMKTGIKLGLVLQICFLIFVLVRRAGGTETFRREVTQAKTVSGSPACGFRDLTALNATENFFSSAAYVCHPPQGFDSDVMVQ